MLPAETGVLGHQYGKARIFLDWSFRFISAVVCYVAVSWIGSGFPSRVADFADMCFDRARIFSGVS